jgi:hypothetical protein
LNPNAIFDWANNIPNEYDSLPNGSTVHSDSGALSATVTFAGGGDGMRLDQGSGWNGNLNGAVLWTNSPGVGPIAFDFSELVTGVGAQVQADYFGPFTFQINAYDGQNNLIDSAFGMGDSNSNGDGSAIFLSVANDANISKVVLQQIDCACDTGAFAIGRLEVTTAPEPGSFVLVFLALGGMAVGCRRRLRKFGERVPIESRKGNA